MGRPKLSIPLGSDITIFKTKKGKYFVKLSIPLGSDITSFCKYFVK